MITSGFTLIELLVIISILSVLLALAVPNLLRSRDQAYDTHAITCNHTLMTAQAFYHNDRETYATRLDQLDPGMTQVCRDVEVAAGVGMPTGRTVGGDGTITATSDSYAFTTWHRQGTRAFETDLAGAVHVRPRAGAF